MDQRQSISVGVVGTSWWADAMYLPALKQHSGARVTAVCGRNAERAEAFARQWAIPHFYTDVEKMLATEPLDALIIATPNNTHYPIGLAALHQGLHVLCEKPLALTYAQAREMATVARLKGLTTMVPFTYHYMPTARYLKELIDNGYLGRLYHLNMRYYTGFGRTGDLYNWRFDAGVAGSGALGDIASHFIYLAYWYFGEIVGLFCQLGHMVPRPENDPHGNPYEVGDDLAVLILEFANGAQGVIQASTLAYEDTPFGQTHQMEFHGSAGTLYHFIDWDKTQRVSGARDGEGAIQDLSIPDHIWGNVRRDTVHNTYKDLFRENDFMTREFISAVMNGHPVTPDFHEGAMIQHIIAAAITSHQQRRWVELAEIG